MSEPTPEEYLASIVALFREHRPELLKTQRGRWDGPMTHPGQLVAGLVFKGPGLLVLVSPWDTTGADEDLWLHVSVSRRDRDPSYAELTECRTRFFHPTDTVLHVWPPVAEHFNLHPHCLHLWTPLDGHRPIPDLRGQGGGV